MGSYASVNGHISTAEKARVSVLDNGFMFGDSVYETLRTYGGLPWQLPRHLARLRASAGRVGIPAPLTDAELASRVDDVLAAAKNEESYIRIMLTRGVGDVSYHFERVCGPTIVVLVKPYERPPATLYTEGVAVVLSTTRRNSPQALDPAIKSGNLLNNIQAIREAQARGAFEAILLNQHGDVAEAASSNVFVVRGSSVRTPPLDAGILPGITRALVIEIGRSAGIDVCEQRLGPEDLTSADEAFITSSLKELAPIRTVDGAPVGRVCPGPLTLELLRLYRQQAHRQVA